MVHTEASNKIYFTKEYSRFRMIEGNRQLNKGKIDRIIREIGNGNDMLRYSPIHVKENGKVLDILDGQHRYYIARHLQKPIHYVIIQEEKTMADVARINSNVEKWKNTDFINCYAQQGNKNYLQLREFIETYGINIGTTLNMLAYNTPGRDGSSKESLKEDFQDGKFTVNYLLEASNLAQDCKKFSKFAGWVDRGFVIAIFRIKEAKQIDIDDLVATHSKYPDILTKHTSPKDYINNLEMLFNHRKQKRTVII